MHCGPWSHPTACGFDLGLFLGFEYKIGAVNGSPGRYKVLTLDFENDVGWIKVLLFRASRCAARLGRMP